MSDPEIYKALECCKNQKCDECPYKKYSIYGCKSLMIKDTCHNFGRLMREVKEKQL
jgi:hypothetical protein